MRSRPQTETSKADSWVFTFTPLSSGHYLALLSANGVAIGAEVPDPAWKEEILIKLLVLSMKD